MLFDEGILLRVRGQSSRRAADESAGAARIHHTSEAAIDHARSQNGKLKVAQSAGGSGSLWVFRIGFIAGWFSRGPDGGGSRIGGPGFCSCLLYTSPSPRDR